MLASPVKPGSGLTLGQLLFSFDGRIGRGTYWACAIPLAVVVGFASVLMDSGDDSAEAIGGVITLVSLWPGFAVMTKRWHDRDKHGAWCLLAFVPYVGTIWILVECGFLAGTDGPNRYGLPERPVLASQPTATAGPNASAISEDIFHLVSMVGRLIRSDGTVSPEEISAFDRFLTYYFLMNESSRKQAFELMRRTSGAFEESARQFHRLHRGDTKLLTDISNFLFELSLVDGTLSAEEEILLSELEEIFALDGSAYSEYRAYSSHEQSKSRTRQADGHHPSDPDKYYGQVLGLKGRITKSDIKRIYRELASQYHPDKVAHLGPKLQEVAAQEMLRINQAYSYFREKYEF